MTAPNSERDRVQFECIDCGREVDREPGKMDAPGITPQRCTQCVLDRMVEP